MNDPQRRTEIYLEGLKIKVGYGEGKVEAELNDYNNGVVMVSFKDTYTNKYQELPVAVRGLGKSKVIKKASRTVAMALHFSKQLKIKGLDKLLNKELSNTLNKSNLYSHSDKSRRKH